MNKKGQTGFFIILGICAVVLIIIGILVYLSSQESSIITIKEKWVKYHGQDAKYLVSSTAGDVYQITDSWIKLRFDSSNLYAYIMPGKTCKVETIGWRLPFFSAYKNILKAECN